MNTRRGTVAAGALTVSLILAGCASGSGPEGMDGMDHGEGGSSSDEATDEQFNAADETFVLMMIPHHEQAIEMSEMLQAKTDVDPQVLELAERIRTAQQPEIDTMRSWLDAWAVPEGAGTGMDHGDDGMMSEEDMAELEAASGPEASSMFLEQMTEHHTGAIAMAQQELAKGENARVLELAQNIVDSQSAEIDKMQELLAQF